MYFFLALITVVIIQINVNYGYCRLTLQWTMILLTSIGPPIGWAFKLDKMNFEVIPSVIGIIAVSNRSCLQLS